jgi:hypothetical protein
MEDEMPTTNVQPERELSSVIADMEDDLRKAVDFAEACEHLVSDNNMHAFYEINGALQTSLENLLAHWDTAFRLSHPIRAEEASA